jgi:GH18 family chitinase
MIKKLFVILCTYVVSINAFSSDNSPLNVAYVEINSNNFANVACYVREDNNKPFFNIATIFGANIHGDDPDKPRIFLNPKADALLNQSSQVKRVQKQGIKVLLTFLADWQNTGWQCMATNENIKAFANDLVQFINQYKLDGIDIDDEYSTCLPDKTNTSMLKLAREIKNHPNFKGILTKALFDDFDYFSAKDVNGDNLAKFLDYGFEMSYGSPNFEDRLSAYLNPQYGMTKNKLGLGVDSGSPPGLSSYTEAAQFVKNNGYAGMMVYNLSDTSQYVLSSIAKVQSGVGVKIIPGCLNQS